MSEWTWLGCDLVTGRIIEELPDLKPSGQLSDVIGSYTSASFDLPIPDAPRDWEGATEPGRCMIAAVLAGTPVWAGIVNTREGGSGPVCQLATVSLAGYLDRRVTGDHTWAQQDDSSVIASGLVTEANTEGIGFALDCAPSGNLRDRQYFDRDDKTAYSNLRELMAIEDGPEWTISLGWTDATQTAISKTFRSARRIGFSSPSPQAVFDSRSESGTSYSYREDYTSERGANHVVAVSSGEGAARPQSPPARDTALLAAGWPRYERRYTPSTSITNQATLDAHSRATLALVARGARVFTVTARADAYPRLGTDWVAGDDVAFDLIGHRHPNGVSGVARCIGWTLDPRAGTVQPVLAGGDDQET